MKVKDIISVAGNSKAYIRIFCGHNRAWVAKDLPSLGAGTEKKLLDQKVEGVFARGDYLMIEISEGNKRGRK